MVWCVFFVISISCGRKWGAISRKGKLKRSRFEEIATLLTNLLISRDIVPLTSIRSKAIICNIKPPPRQVTSLHQQILHKVEERMAGQKISLERGSRGPALVTVVNSSRVYADIKRDIEAARLTGILRTLCCLLRLYFLSFLLFVVRSSNNMHVYVSFVVCFVRLKKFSDITLRI